MCTVTYLPTPGGYFFTSNRDESPERVSGEIRTRELSDQRLLYPLDSSAGGTWLAVSNADRLVCILNGAFQRHDRRPPYRRSRGLMALDYFSFPDPEAFFRQYQFKNMEPFTMVILEGKLLWDFKWDGRQRYLLPLDPEEPYIWSSATLYSLEMAERRARWFYRWLTEHGEDYDSEKILHLHRTGGEGDPFNDYVMNRGNLVRTVSITHVKRDEERFHMRHEPLMGKEAIKYSTLHKY